MTPLLRVSGVEKHYEGVYALRKADFEVAAGEVHALVGENGAGKSTLGKVIAGVVRPEAGDISLMGRTVIPHPPVEAQRLGISMIFQEMDLFPNLTVAENLVIGNLQYERGAWVRFRDLDRHCAPFLGQVGLRASPRARVAALSLGEMQLLAIARALSMRARLIIMDEPTSALPGDAARRLFGLIRRLRDDGVSVVYISHKLDEVFAVSDRVTVLRDGRTVGCVRAADASVPEVIRMMIGRDVPPRAREAGAAAGAPILSVRGLCTRKLRDVSFDLRAGEVLGVAGLVGAGRSELGAALFGLDPATSGSVVWRGRAVRPHSPRAAMSLGFGLLPEDRKRQGLMMRMSALENASIASLSRLQRAGVICRGREARAVEAVHRQTLLKAASPATPVSTLSGGNQQKVLLARWLLVDPDVLFLDDPTRGIDVAAKQDLYGLIVDLARRGKGILLASSELPELLRLSDRILVLRAGAAQGILEADEATEERVLALAAAGGAGEN